MVYNGSILDKRTSLKSYLLENLDIIRDKILLTPGDVEFDISNESMSIPPFTEFAKRTHQKNLNTTNFNLFNDFNFFFTTKKAYN